MEENNQTAKCNTAIMQEIIRQKNGNIRVITLEL